MKANVKVSIELPEDIARFVEEYRIRHGLANSREVFVQALRLLHERELEQAYQAASREWDISEEAKLWEQTVGDGL